MISIRATFETISDKVSPCEAIRKASTISRDADYP